MRLPQSAIRVEGGTEQEQSEFLHFLLDNFFLVKQTPLSPAALRELGTLKAMAGFQQSKCRGTFQCNFINDIARGHTDLGAFFNNVRISLEEGAEAEHFVNSFANINEGVNRGGATVKMWHRDNFSEGTAAYETNMRAIFAYMEPGKTGRLLVMSDADQPVTVYISIPKGCGILGTCEGLRMRHRHGSAGHCLTMINELSVDRVSMFVEGAPSADRLAAIAADQPLLDITASLGPFNAADFKASPSRFGGGFGGGSQRRLAKAALRGLAGRRSEGSKRKMTSQQANEMISVASKEEIEGWASKGGLIIAAMGYVRFENPELDLHGARNVVRKMSDVKIAEAASKGGLITAAMGYVRFENPDLDLHELRDVVRKMSDVKIAEAARKMGTKKAAGGCFVGLTYGVGKDGKTYSVEQIAQMQKEQSKQVNPRARCVLP